MMDVKPPPQGSALSLVPPRSVVDQEVLGHAILTCDLFAISRNYKRLAATVAPARVASVVKADAYWLGAEQVALELQQAGCSDFFVAHSFLVAALGSKVSSIIGQTPARDICLNEARRTRKTDDLRFSV